MSHLAEALHNISGSKHNYELFTGANTHTPISLIPIKNINANFSTQ